MRKTIITMALFGFFTVFTAASVFARGASDQGKAIGIQVQGDWTTYTDKYGALSVTAYSGTDTQVTVPDSIAGKAVTKIGERAFAGKSAIVSITIPDSVRAIKEGAFRGCTKLSSVTLPSALSEIDEGLFAGCTSLESITLPSAVSKIDEEAFSGCTALNVVTLPSSLEKIDENAFYGCTALKSLSLPSSLEKVEKGAFTGCTALDNATRDALTRRFGAKAVYGL